MKAAVLEQLNSPLVVCNLISPPLSYGQVLIEVHSSGICGAQIREITGSKGEDPYLPHLLGHEGGGIVVSVGPGVKYVKRGDHVVMHWRKGMGIEASFPVYLREGVPKEGHNTWDKIGAGSVTTFNEHAVVSENRLTVIEKDIPFDVAALMGCAVTTGLGLINNEAKLKIGQSIAVAGCGGVGLNVIQGAAMVSANPIIAIDFDSYKLDFAEVFGATHTIWTKHKSAKDLIEDSFVKLIGRKTVDVFVDCTGDPEMIEMGLCLVSPGGKLILVGQPYHECDLVLRSFHRHYCGKMIIDSQGGLTNPSVDIPHYLDLYRTGKLKLDELITHRFPLEKVNEAIHEMQFGKYGRIILEMI